VSLRQALPLVALALTLAFAVLRVAPSGGAEEPKPFVPFGESITARAPKLPAYAANAQTRIEQQLASATALWTTAFKDAGDTYEPPVLAAAKDGCGTRGGWAGIYCDGTIVIDVSGHVERHGLAGQALADTVLGYVVAHEVGHHVQTLRKTGNETLRRELHADCLAGVWGKAAGIPLPPMWAYGEDAEHGTAAQRVKWLNEGYRSARPSDCDAIWSTSTSP
jgi:predicted metalloprotease